METTAVYWESKIKTYGFQLERDLSLLILKIDQQKLHLYGHLIEKLGDLGIKFSLVFGQFHDSSTLNVFMAVKSAPAERLLDYLSHDSPAKGGEDVYRITPVEILSFQGPHYGDRYGIAFTLLETLKSGGISIIASCCSVSCIYLLLKGGKADEAREILLKNFEIPSKSNHRKGLLKRNIHGDGR